MAIFRKQLQFQTKAREKLLKGMEILAEAVGATLGPRGRNVAIDYMRDQDVAPVILHDGVTVARNINLEDRFEDMGVRLLKDAAIKTNEKAGDGTTTATLLAQSIVKEAHKHIEAGANPMQLKKVIEEASKQVIQKLKEMSKEVSTAEERQQVATISAADAEIGRLVAEALDKVGKDGTVTVEEGKSFETTVEYKQGMEIDRGYLSPYFVTNKERVEAEIENPYILITDRDLNYHYEILPFLEKFVKETKSKNLVIIAGAVVEEALATLVANKLRGTINVVAIQAPAFGGRRTDELEDIAALTGGHVLLSETGRELKSVEIGELGLADKFIADRDRSVIIGGKGNTKKRMDDLREQIKLPNTEFDEVIKKERLAKLSGGVAVINVGGITEVEVKEKKERVIDAVNATKAAIDEGIVAGGQITLLNLGSQAPESLSGERILKEALKTPFKKLISNAGLDYAEVMRELSGKSYPYGIDVMDGKVKDMIKSGIIDPVKVERSALENAVSVATMTMTTDVLVTDILEDTEKPL